MKYLPSETAVPDWKLDWKQIQPALDRARKSISSLKSSSLEVMRVSQLDSDILDKELIDILSEQLWSALSYFKTTFKEKYEPELLAVIQLVLFKYSLYDSSATYGAQLQNLKYRNERMHKGPLESIAKDAPLTKSQKIGYGLLTVGGQYVWTRLSRLTTEKGWGELEEDDIRHRAYKILQIVEKYWKLLSFMNFLVFLRNGKYRTLIDRLLCMRLVYAKKSVNREVSFEFLNRQMVWHAFTEFLLFLVPLVNIEKLKLKAMHMLLPKSFILSKGYDQLPLDQCAICHENDNGKDFAIHNPYETNCGHTYCYYCIQSKLSTVGDEWLCLRCGQKVVDIKKFIEIVDQ